MIKTLPPEGVTRLLQAWQGGDQAALHELTTLVQDELRRIARHYTDRGHPDDSLQATALVNELYLRLENLKNVDWEHRNQFYALSARIMRNILVDAARARRAAKRGRDGIMVSIDDQDLPAREPDEFLLELNDALNTFAQAAPRQAKVVELRYFGGMTEEQVAEILEISVRTVRRDWQFARAWLQQELTVTPARTPVRPG